MRQVKTYTIKERKDGGTWMPLRFNQILAFSWEEAKRLFAKEVYHWFNEKGNDDDIAAVANLESIDTFSRGCYTWTIRKV